jgi:hypothetical protein
LPDTPGTRVPENEPPIDPGPPALDPDPDSDPEDDPDLVAGAFPVKISSVSEGFGPESLDATPPPEARSSGIGSRVPSAGSGCGRWLLMGWPRMFPTPPVSPPTWPRRR